MRTELPAGVIIATYKKDMAVCHTKWQWTLLLLLLVLLYAVPISANKLAISFLLTVFILVIAVHGLNILTGYCGQISLGHAAFMAVGAFTSAILYSRVGLPFFLCLLSAGLCAGVIGIIFGLPAARIKGLYLVMNTLAAQFVIMWVIVQFPQLTGGAMGTPTSRPIILGIDFSSNTAWYWLVLSLTILFTFFAKNIVRTRVGRAFVALRDNDLASEMGGINIWYYKTLAFFIGCFFAGIAGSLWAHNYCIAHPEPFDLLVSVWLLGMIIVGGMGSLAGGILGILFLQLIELGMLFTPEILSGVSTTLSTALTLMLQGVIIIVFLIFEPRGLYHRWWLFRNYYRLWPFGY
jgi:branched-chain amino acid transport system permease protein